MLGWQACITAPNLLGAGVWTQGLVHARQALYQPGCIPTCKQSIYVPKWELIDVDSEHRPLLLKKFLSEVQEELT